MAELKTIDAFPQLKNKGYVTARNFMQLPNTGQDTTIDSLDAGFSLQSEILAGSMTTRSKNNAFKVATYMDDAQIN